MEETYSFGYWVRRRRKALDLTQDALADRVGCTRSAVKKIEADERRPSQLMAERLAECLRVPEEERALFIDSAAGRAFHQPLARGCGTFACSGPAEHESDRSTHSIHWSHG